MKITNTKTKSGNVAKYLKLMAKNARIINSEIAIQNQKNENNSGTSFCTFLWPIFLLRFEANIFSDLNQIFFQNVDKSNK